MLFDDLHKNRPDRVSQQVYCFFMKFLPLNYLIDCLGTLMFIPLLFLLVFHFPWEATGESSIGTRKYNRLIHEKSPYLQQHVDNAIWWYPWGEEAFQAARNENKPIFLSIGYSTCHWCHVMEGDSFNDEAVAAMLNKHFIAIKVDREERPDVDQIYMDILLAMQGQGGWPISMFLTAERIPFTGATFIPRERFIPLLRQIATIWQNNRDQIEEIGLEVSAWLAKQENVAFANAPLPDEDVMRKYFYQSQQSFDFQYGGFGHQPKFPNIMQLRMLLRIHKRTDHQKALEMVQKTLDGMARGGIHDHLGGGFHRYSTDQKWHVPHFEKMLYSNALLSLIYLEAYQVTQNEEYALVARRTLDYILRDMTHPLGGFYSAEDADSEKTEGKFYVWTEKELREILSPQEFARISQVYPVTLEGNFNPEARIQAIEEKAGMKSVKQANILLIDIEAKMPDFTDPLLRQAHKKLFEVREKRVRPHLDDKILTAWNGLMISAMAKGYQTLGAQKYLDASRKAAHFLLDNMRKSDGSLQRRWRDGAVEYNGYLDDYAYLIQGLLLLYQSDFDRYWYQSALELQQHQDALFWDEINGSYYFSDGRDAMLLQRKKIFSDKSLPSGNAIAVLNLLQIADLSLQRELRKKAARIISHDGLQMMESPFFYSQMLIGLDYLLDRSKEIALIGPPEDEATQRIVQMLHRQFLPNKVLAMGPPVEEEQDANTTLPLLFNKPMFQGKPTAYVCENNICQLPTNDLSKIVSFVNEHKGYSL